MAAPTLASIRSDATSTAFAYLRDASRMADLPGDAPAFEEFTAPAIDLMGSGKRTRAALLAAAYVCAGGARDTTPAIHAGAALELYQASALIHDDVIDHAPLRRGRPASHIAFAIAHRRRGWAGDADDFGVASAILLGDLLLSLSMEAATRAASTARGGEGALALFSAMTGEVAFGQYLDNRAGHLPRQDDPVAAAMSVITHKSARYSVVYPLAIGARLAGADPTVEEALAAIGRPLGVAFQLRDDDLGIFGDAGVTGKPLCGDVSEGKRTVLLALTRQRADRRDVDWLDSLAGSDVTEADAERIRDIVASCGARARHEALISEREAASRAAWEKLDASGATAEGIDLLGELLEELAGRTN